MKAETRIRGVELKVERSCLNGFLFFAVQAGEAVGEGVGNSEVHDAIFLLAMAGC